jgi:hypothetical protein
MIWNMRTRAVLNMLCYPSLRKVASHKLFLTLRSGGKTPDIMSKWPTLVVSFGIYLLRLERFLGLGLFGDFRKYFGNRVEQRHNVMPCTSISWLHTQRHLHSSSVRPSIRSSCPIHWPLVSSPHHHPTPRSDPLHGHELLNKPIDAIESLPPCHLFACSPWLF